MRNTLTQHAAGAALGLTLFALASIASATSITVNPVRGSTSAAVTIGVADVTANAAVGSYDISLVYDARYWAATSVSFGSFLSGTNPMNSITTYEFTPGAVHLFEISLVTSLDPQPLNVLQPDTFAFATINFAALNPGVGFFNVSSAQLYDEFGDAMAISAVPEPSAILLAMLGIGVIAGRIRAKGGMRGKSAVA